MFDIDKPAARQLICLFRFAWVCRLEKAKNFSDFTFKSLVVIPQNVNAEKTHAQVEEVVDSVFHSLQRASITQPDLQWFSQHYPDVPIKFSVKVMSLPKPLYKKFDAAHCEIDRLNFVIKYQLGEYYLRKHIRRQPTRFPNSKEEIASLTDSEWEHLFSQIVYLKTKIGKGGKVKKETVPTFGLTPTRIQDMLKQNIDHPDDELLEQSSGLFNAIIKDDLVDNLRGLWTVKSGVSKVAAFAQASPGMDQEL